MHGEEIATIVNFSCSITSSHRKPRQMTHPDDIGAACEVCTLCSAIAGLNWFASVKELVNGLHRATERLVD